jgi:hypothetical protein
MSIIRAVVAGERDVRCKENLETICSALVRNYRPEHIFALMQAPAFTFFISSVSMNAASKFSEQWLA